MHENTWGRLTNLMDLNSGGGLIWGGRITGLLRYNMLLAPLLEAPKAFIKLWKTPLRIY